MKLLNQRFIMVKFKWSLRKWRFMVATMTWLTVTEYLCHKWPRKCSVCHNHICSHSWLITRFVTRVTRRVPHVLQELLTHKFTPVVSEVHVGQSLVFCVVYCRLSFVLLSSFFWPLCCLFFFDLRLLIIPFDHCIVCPSIYDFWLLLLTIVLSVLLRSTTSDYPFWPLHCLSFDLQLLITPFDHCVVCSSSIYDFWLPLLTIALSVLRSTTSDYPLVSSSVSEKIIQK
jgi:hypothetical protein